jgi:signal transduction histidine kinase
MNKNSEILNFEVSSFLKSVIGKDLINNDFVALFELVKNSFDARAKNVEISFEVENDQISKIIILDDGKGMSYDDLVGKWLKVAHSAKQDGSEDGVVSRVYAGNKGVGRFSCDRLGGRLRLQSKSEKDSVVHVLNVDWGDFEKDSKVRFENIDIKYHTESNFSSSSKEYSLKTSGVILEISSLREPLSWDRKKLLRLKRNLAKLVNPFGNSVVQMRLNLHCQREREQDLIVLSKGEDSLETASNIVNGEVKNTIFDVLKLKTTWLQVDLDNNGYFTSTLVDRGELIYKIKESAAPYTELLDSGFSCQIFYLNLSAKHTFKSRSGVDSVSFGSLFMFRNGFRVFPVGEEGDDYWKVDRRHQQGYSRTLGTRDIMGRVDIAGPESKFKESSSRDKGLVETEASKQLFDYVVTKCLRRLENYVVGVTWHDKIDKTYDTAERLALDENRSNIIDVVSKLAGAKDIELLEYSQNLIDVLDEKSNYFEGSVERLAKLAESIEDDHLKNNIDLARKRFVELKKAEEEALRIASEEMSARAEAEKKAKQEAILRFEAEQETVKQVQLRTEAENKAETLYTAYDEEKKRNLFLLSSENKDKEQLESFLHQIIIYTASAKQKITSALLSINDPNQELDREKISGSLSDLLESVDKVMTTSRFATTANFKLDSTKIKDDIGVYIEQYLNTISTAYNSRIQIKVEQNSKPFITNFTPIELSMVLDNLVSNAKKSRASIIFFKIETKTNGIIEVLVEDNGRGLDKSLIEPSRIFEKGVTTTRGSGLGLFHSKKQIEKMGGDLVLPDQPEKGFKILIRLRKT